MSTAAVPPPARRAALVFVYAFVGLESLAFGIMLPVMPPLVKSFVGGDTAEASRMLGVFLTAWALMQFLFSPLIGLLSDRFGRRPVLLISCTGLGLDYILMALAPNLTWLFIGRVISGITAASYTTAGAYIADVTPQEKRAGAWGFVGAMWAVGFILGPAVGGVLGENDPRLPFWVAAGMTLLNAAFGLFVMPESLPPERRARFDWRKANPIGSLALLKRHRELMGLSIVNFIFHACHHALPAAFVLYAGYRYNWGPQAVGVSLMVAGLFSTLYQVALVKPAVAKFGDRRVLLAGLVGGVLGYTLIGLAPTGVLLFGAIAVLELMSLYGPPAYALMTRLVEPNEQGQLQGAQTSIMGITGLFAPAVFSLVFAAGIEGGADLPGAPFLLAGFVMLLSLPLAVRVTRPA